MSRKHAVFHIVALGFILIVALLLRTTFIDTAPPGLYPDEANNATNAYDAMTSGDYQWFYPDNNGREGLYINAMALGFTLFGVTPLSVKLPSILFGVMAVLGIYLLGRELFRSTPRIALIAAYLSAVSFWAINFSRIGFRAIMMLPILTFSFYFLFRGIRTQRYSNYIIGGAIFGLGFHSYLAFRIAPALLLALLILLLLIDGNVLKRYWRALAGFVIAAALVAAPLLWTLHTHPAYTTQRTGDVSILALPSADIAPTLAKNIALSLGKFNVYGDPNFRHNYAPYPLLEPLTGIFFVVGLVIAVGGFFRYLILRFTRDVRNRHLVVYGLLLAWFIAFLAPEFLTKEGLPHALRSIGTLPVVYFFAAMGISALIDWIITHRNQSTYALLGLVALFLMYVGVFNTVKYHVFWAHNPKAAVAFHKELTDVSAMITDLPAYREKVVIAGWLERLPIELYHENDLHITYIHPDYVNDLTLDNNTIVLLPTYNADVIKNLQTRYSAHGLITEEHHTSLGTVFYTLRFPHTP